MQLLIKESSKLNTEIGSSTLVVLTIDPILNILKTANIGDSGYLIARIEKHKVI